jgi:hypothetical protein
MSLSSFIFSVCFSFLFFIYISDLILNMFWINSNGGFFLKVLYDYD